jgi:hypothetical protein
MARDPTRGRLKTQRGYKVGYGDKTKAPRDSPAGHFRSGSGGEPRRTRTFNQLIKSQLLYH